MTSTQAIATDSFKEVTNRNHSFQPGLEAVYHPPHGDTYAVQPVPLFEKPMPVPEKRRVNFWLFVAVGILGLAVIGLAVGLGVGLGRGNGSDTASSAGAQDTTDPSPSATTPSNEAEAEAETYTTTITRTATTSPSSTSSPTSSPTSPCPSANNTLISPTLGTTRYRIHCDSDISGSDKITLSSIVVDTFDACLALCNTMNYFQDRTDVGATFNVAGTGTQTPGTCWCLGGDALVVTENVGNDVAFPVGG
ncbi:hypothetical protein BJY00DRAFT_308406 [Aspergillus carlsbadensis]|nr:hypothetical protein BJY00DRAFT_308406 [Aspergillus carlsbadensis]